jgi:hypothetical protein
MNIADDSQIAAIPGWFDRIDVEAFRTLLGASTQKFAAGDLAELGVYKGKSAVLVGSYLRPGEIFTVVDLFGAEADDAENGRENAEQYSGLTRRSFETEYRRVHQSLPVIIEDFSSSIFENARIGAHRFVHIDASHMYEHVKTDIAGAQRLLMAEGVVVLDDYRREHTPGVAAAAWQAVAEGLHPFLLTPGKMYATWGDPTPWREDVSQWLKDSAGLESEVQAIAQERVIRAWPVPPKLKQFVPPAAVPLLSRIRTRVSGQ